MPHLLKGLRISDVSSVDKGAGEGCEVVFMKRDDSATLLQGIKKACDEMRDRSIALLRDAAAPDVGIAVKKIVSDGSDRILDQMAESMASIIKRSQAKPDPSQQDDPAEDGDSEADDNQDDEPTEKSMSTTIITVAKGILNDGADAYPSFTKADFWREIQSQAKEVRKAGETMEQATSRFMLDTPIGGLLYKAYKVAKNAAPAAPKLAEPETSAAYKKMAEKAVDLQKRDAGLSKEQAFAKIYGDPSNRDLVIADRQWSRARIGA